MTHQRTDYEAFIAESNENRRAVRQRELIIEVTEAIYAEMERSHVTKGQLAARLGRTPAFVTQILNGGRNLTLKTIADVAVALGVNVRLRLEPVSVQRELPAAGEERRVRYAAKKWGKKLPVCEGVTAMGERCRLEARRESKFCRLHGDKSGGAE